MPNDQFPQSIADLRAQRGRSPNSTAAGGARYSNTGSAFTLQLPRVPDESCTAEPAKALHQDTPTGLVACDRSKELGCAFPATTPLVLARYARIRAGESLETNFAASGVISYVIVGSGSTVCGSERIEWNSGDTFVLPGGIEAVHQATPSDVVLWIVTNEPQLAFENLRPPQAGQAPTDLVHFPADEVQRQIELLYQVGRGEDIAGSALIFSSERQESIRNVLPTLTVAMNSLPAGKSQRPHRHNSVAVSLVIQGKDCYSIVDGRRKDWSPWATTVTPATSVHSHHNGGSRTAMFLIVQDGGIYYFTRALGFEFAAD